MPPNRGKKGVGKIARLLGGQTTRVCLRRHLHSIVQDRGRDFPQTGLNTVSSHRCCETGTQRRHYPDCFHTRQTTRTSSKPLTFRSFVSWLLCPICGRRRVGNRLGNQGPGIRLSHHSRSPLNHQPGSHEGGESIVENIMGALPYYLVYALLVPESWFCTPLAGGRSLLRIEQHCAAPAFLSEYFFRRFDLIMILPTP